MFAISDLQKSNLPTDAQAAEESASAPAEEKPSEQKSDSPEPTSSEGETKDAGVAVRLIFS